MQEKGISDIQKSDSSHATTQVDEKLPTVARQLRTYTRKKKDVRHDENDDKDETSKTQTEGTNGKSNK